MLMNFSEPCLLSKVSCNTASNEGNEVTNLVNGSDKGFIAYYAVRAPVHIDFELVCKVQLSHIVIWPSVGAQKTSGLKLSVKQNDVVSVFLKAQDQSVFLYRNDFDYKHISKPANVVERYIQLSKFPTINATDRFRISILKTDNSVPALRRIEIWARVSPVCDPTTKTTLESLWMKRFNNIERTFETVQNNDGHENENDDKKTEEVESLKDLLDIPEEFIDPITCEIMIRPIVLPSGKIIDHSTLEKHKQSETARGRTFSDPFTGLAFNEQRVAIPAFALKERIDKFLLLHSDDHEIKKMPRILGSKQKRPAFSSAIVMSNDQVSTSSNEKVLKKRKVSSADAERPQQTHRLPFCAFRNQARLVPKAVQNKVENKKSDLVVVRRTNTNAQNMTVECECCSSDRILYRLPCKHVICRKTLLRDRDRCNICDISYKSSDPIRIHV